MNSSFLTSAAALLGLAASLPGQSGEPSVLQLNADYHFGSIGVAIPDPVQPGARRLIYADIGTARFNSNLDFTAASSGIAVYSDLQVVSTSDSDAGTYRVLPQGRIELDANPAQPGTVVEELYINRDGTAATGTREAPDPESWLSIVLQKSTGQSNASLSGDYFAVGLHFAFTTGGLISSSERGTIRFDGAGGFQASGQVQRVQASGASSVTSFTDSGSYNIAGDGTILDGNGRPWGAIAPDAEIFFVVDRDGASHHIALVVGIKVGSAYTMGDIAGRWAAIVHEAELGSGPSLPEMFTESATLGITAASASTGTYQGQTVGTYSNPSSSASSAGGFSGTITANASGMFQFLDSAGPPADEFMLSANGQFFLGTAFTGITDMVLAMRVCDGSAAYGSSTPGRGGIHPQIGMSGYPWIGNSSFAVRTVAARGGAPGVFIIATAPSAGFPFFGGTFLLDPLQIATTFGTSMSGASGAGGQGEALLPLPIPAQPFLAGSSLFVQCFILDGNAPQGLAMTKGFGLAICR